MENRWSQIRTDFAQTGPGLMQIGYAKFTYLFVALPKFYLMSEYPPCPKCKSTYTYEMDDQLVCPECGHEWKAETAEVEEAVSTETKVLDANGNELHNGDTVVVIKDLPVKGAPKSIKAGTKVKNIRLTDGDHNIDCKIDGFGSMGLKSEFVRKA